MSSCLEAPRPCQPDDFTSALAPACPSFFLVPEPTSLPQRTTIHHTTSSQVGRSGTGGGVIGYAARGPPRSDVRAASRARQARAAAVAPHAALRSIVRCTSQQLLAPWHSSQGARRSCGPNGPSDDACDRTASSVRTGLPLPWCARTGQKCTRTFAAASGRQSVC